MSVLNINLPSKHGTAINFTLPVEIKPNFFIRILAFIFRFKPEYKQVQTIFLKHRFVHLPDGLKVGSIYLDKHTGIKFIVMRVDNYPSTQKTVQFGSFTPVPREKAEKVKLPMILRPIGKL